MVLVLPPPPFMTGEFQPLNRWLLEIQSIFNTGGFIDPSQVDGLVAAYADIVTLQIEVAVLQADVLTLQGQVAANTAAIAVNTAAIAVNTAAIAALDVRITALEARGEILNGLVAPAAGLGKVNDWYTDTVAKHIYVKTGAATWTLIV